MAHEHVAYEFQYPPTWVLANPHLMSKVTNIEQKNTSRVHWMNVIFWQAFLKTYMFTFENQNTNGKYLNV